MINEGRAEPHVSIVDASKKYGRGRVAFEEVTWDFATSRVGLIGPNGAGKSSLLRCLAGIDTLTSGTVSVPDVMGVGFVPQRATYPNSMRVSDIIEYCAWLRAIPGQALKTAALRAAQVMDIESLLPRRFGQLSGGQQQKVAIASALVHKPRLLVLDEPTVGLDPSGRLAFRRLLRDIEGVDCVVLSTHLADDVDQVCDEVGVLVQGKLAFSGSVSDLKARAQPSADGHGSRLELAYDAVVKGHAW